MTDQVTTKVCSKCKVEKEFEFFTKDKSRKNGVKSICKICNKEKSKAYREANPEKVRAAKKAYREANPEKVRAAVKAYRDRYTDAYVAKAFQCPQELIELKRINLLIKREIRNQQQCQN